MLSYYWIRYMKKYLFILFFVLILPVFSIFNHIEAYQHYLSVADSGFDSDYGDYDSGGSWDSGGSSWDNDYSYGGSSGGSIDSKYLPVALFFVTGVVGVLIVSRHAINVRETQKRTEKRINSVLLGYYNLQPGDGSKDELVQAAYANYVNIQKAWMNRDLTNVRNLLTDEIYNMYQMQIETLIEDNQINVMSDFEFVCGGVSYKRTKNNIQTIKIILCVNCKDYIEEAQKHKVVNGDRRAKITYIYELTFIREINSSKTINCPTCGAEVKKQMSAVCPYCNNLLLLNSADITMSNKLILHQFKR